MNNSDETSVLIGEAGDLTDPAANRKAQEVSERLRQAVRIGGGVTQVAAKSGVTQRSLSRYLGGYDMKLPAIVAISDACGVTVEWLATGRGPMRQGESPRDIQEVPVTAPPARPDDRGLFNSIHIDKLAGCIEAAQDEFARRQQTPPMRRVLQVALVLYDALEAEEAEAKAAKPP